jgi:hypothetical protein
VSDPDYRRALDAACREWEQLAGRRAEIDNRLADLQRTIATLSRLCGYEPTVPFGLADACRMVLRRHGDRALTAQAVRDELELIGLDLSRHASPLASIHVTLKRLVAAGEARFLPGERGTPPMYALHGPSGARGLRGRGPGTAPWPSFVGAPRGVRPLAKGKKR